MDNLQKRKQEYRKKREAHLRKLNPFPERGQTERLYVSRTLDKIKGSLNYWLNEVEGHYPEWYPSIVVTSTNELDFVSNRDTYLEMAGRGLVSSNGFLIEHGKGKNQKATNRIKVATTYRSEATGNLFGIERIIVSPLPCPVWGVLPLTLSQWNIIAYEMIWSHVEWCWLHAVRDYMHDQSYQPEEVFGWRFLLTEKIDDQAELIPCTGRVIYRHITEQYSKHVNTG